MDSFFKVTKRKENPDTDFWEISEETMVDIMGDY